MDSRYAKAQQPVSGTVQERLQHQLDVCHDVAVRVEALLARTRGEERQIESGPRFGLGKLGNQSLGSRLKALKKQVDHETKRVETLCARGGEGLTPETVGASAAYHLDGVVATAETAENLETVLVTFPTGRTGKSGRVEVDVVDQDGARWTKVKSAPPEKLHRIWRGSWGGPERCPVNSAVLLLEAARRQRGPQVGQRVEVVCSFMLGVSHQMAGELEGMGVTVKGERVEVVDDVLDESDDESDDSQEPQSQAACVGIDSAAQGPTEPSPSSVDVANLDVSTLLVLVADGAFTDEETIQSGVTDSQLPNAESDRLPPRARQNLETKRVKDARLTGVTRTQRLRRQVESFIHGRRVVACEAAWRGLETILSRASTTVHAVLWEPNRLRLSRRNGSEQPPYAPRLR